MRTEANTSVMNYKVENEALEKFDNKSALGKLLFNKQVLYNFTRGPLYKTYFQINYFA